MAAFHYIAMTASGEKKKGAIEADSAKQARQKLRQRELTPLEVTPAEKKLKLFSRRIHQYAMSSKELATLTRQLSSLLSAGLPIEEVLGALAEQSEKPQIKNLMTSVRSKVLEGHDFATALRDFPDAFSNLYCATVAAGERSGHLDHVLERLADYTERQYEMRQKILHALIYPAVMVLVSLGIVGFLLEYVVPKMIAVYTNINQTLPTMTRVLISISTGMQNEGPYLLLILIAAIFAFRYQLKNSISFATRMHHLLLRIPVIGNAIKAINTARFSRTFAILSAAGVPLLEAMHIAASLINIIPIREAVTEAVNRIREGTNVHLALKQTGYFPPTSIHLIASGESSGQLENMLERAANNQDNDITRLIDTSLALFEPMIILLMGAIVLFIVLAVLLPIFQLDQFGG